jgi:hypothetical protein
MAEQPLSKFKAEFERYGSMWKSIEIRALFARKEEQWVVLKGLAYLRDTEPTQYGHKVTFDSLILRAVVEYRKIDSIWTLVDEMLTGKIHLGDTDVVIGTGVRPQESSFVSYMSPSRSGRPAEKIFPYLTLYLSLGAVHEYVDENEINRLLNSYGYQGGLQEFSVAKTGEPVGSRHFIYFGIVAPIYLVAYGESEPGYIKASVLCGEGIKPDDVTLSYELYGKTEAKTLRQDKLVFSQDDKHVKEGNTYLERKIAVPQEALSARLLVYYRNNEIPADSFNILIGGVKATILTAFEALGQIAGKGAYVTLWDRFTSYLGVQNKAADAGEFELGVWILLTISGLHVLHLGKVFGKGFDLPGVDLLAFAEREKEIILISCTIENKLSQKIEPLISQLNAVRNKMPDWSVKGAIFAPIERADITIGSFLDAAESNICVLLRREILEILTITKGASADASTRTLEVLKRRLLLYRLSKNPLDAFRAWLREPKQPQVQQ